MSIPKYLSSTDFAFFSFGILLFHKMLESFIFTMKRILTILLTILVMYVPVYADQVSYAYDTPATASKEKS